jgi:hypothetical protein
VKTKEVIAIVRYSRGPLYVGVLARSDVIYIQAVKKDLLQRLERVADHELTAVVSKDSGCVFIDNDTSEIA